jgi:spore germination protein KB
VIKLSDGKIGKREFCALITITIGVKGTDTTPDLFTTAGQNAAWLMTALSLVIILIPLLVLLSLIKKHNMGLMELVFSLTGKKIGFLIGMLLFLMLLTSTTINSRAHIDIVTTLFFPRTELTVLLLIFLIFCYMIAKRSLEAVTRTAWLLFWWINGILFLLIALVWPNTNWMNLFPILGPGIQPLVMEGLRHSGLFNDAILFTVFYTFTRSYKEFRFSILFGFGGSFLWIVALMLTYQMVYDYPAVDSINYIFQQMTRITSVAGSMTQLEALYLAFWVMISVIHFAAYIFAAAYVLARTINIRRYEPLLLTITGLIVLGGLIPHHVVDLNDTRESLVAYYSAIFMTLPFLLWILDRWKGRMSH